MSGLIIGIITACSTDLAHAQRRPVADTTLGNENSRVISDEVINGVLSDRIDGGARRGANLFHSFEQFSIDAGRAAYFTNPAGVENILSRVTGEVRSEIFGRLGVLGNANLFLINPQGIVFGPNASLDVRGSFIGTTASAVRLQNRGLFSASEPEASVLLTVRPSALVFQNQLSQPIINRSRFDNPIINIPQVIGPTGLQVLPNQTLALVGGDLLFRGGGLTAAGGRIELGSVNGDGEVRLRPHPQGWTFGYRSLQNFGTIQLEDGASVNAGLVGGGNIQVQASRLRLLDGSRLYNQPLLARLFNPLLVDEASGGSVVINTTDLVELSGVDRRIEGRIIPGGLVTSTSGPSGSRPGDIVITTRRFIARDGATVSAASFISSLPAGNIRVNAAESVVLDGATLAPGPSPDRPDRLFITNLATGGPGITGSIRIDTRRLVVENGAAIFTSSTGVSGGDLVINASESVRLSGASIPARIDDTSEPVRVPTGLYADSLTSEAADEVRDSGITINTARLQIEDGAVISVSFLSPEVGQGGGVQINASESIDITGASPNGIRSGIYAQSFAAGRSGDLNIATGQLSLSHGGQISVNATGAAPGGVRLPLLKDILRAILPDLELDERIDNFAPPDQRGTGEAGNIQIQAASTRLDAGSITASTPSRDGGSITLNTRDILSLRRGSTISTAAGTEQQGGGGDGGNITIDADVVIASLSENSDINANAFDGQGGNIDITTQGIFGIEFQESPTPLSDITASSEFGIDGEVSINTPDVDPSRGLAELPGDVVDASDQIAQACPSAGVAAAQGEFVVTGRGGLPPGPDEIHSSDGSSVDLVTTRLDSDDSLNETESDHSDALPPQIVEAQGWNIDDEGQVTLVATMPTMLDQSWSRCVR